MRTHQVLLPLLLATAASQAGVYRWTDAEGTVHFSQSPPPDTHAEPVTVKPPPADSGLSDPSLGKSLEQFERRRADRKKQQEETAKRAEAEKRRLANCEKARKNLATVTSRGRVRVIRANESVALTEEERQALIRKLEKQIQKFCDQ